MKLLSHLQLLITSVSALAVQSLEPRVPDVASDLKSLVSAASTVSVDLRLRWSVYNAPVSSVVVNVTTEKDVAAVVKYCVKAGIPFLPQNGGNGWAKQFDLGLNGVLINLAGLNKVMFSKDKKEVTIGGGAIIGDVVRAADAAGALVLTGNCNCVGALGAVLGGGYGNLMGENGFAVDNLISAKVVIATGEIVTASKTSYPDLFWALRGAGPNFGVVVSATMKSVPAAAQDRTSWITTLTFDPAKIQDVAQAIQDLPLMPQQVVYLVLTNTGPPNNAPAVMVTGFLRKGTEETGRKAFAPLYALNPLTNSSAVLPYTQWNGANDNFCAREDRKPAYSTSINNMQPSEWPRIWSLYTEFQKMGPNSAVLIERYNLTKAASVPTGTTAFQDALRKDVFAQAIVIPWYTDKVLDTQAETFAAQVRSIWSFSSSPQVNPTYINFAHGDESLEAIYGNALPRLRKLKETWDPSGAFNQWFRIK